MHSHSNILKPPCCATNLVKSGKTDIAKAAGFRPWPADEASVVKQNYEQRLKAVFEALKNSAGSRLSLICCGTAYLFRDAPTLLDN